MDLNKRIRLLINLTDTNQKQFAEIAEVGPSAISQILSGENKNLASKTARKISDKLSLSYEWVKDGKGEAPVVAMLSPPVRKDLHQLRKEYRGRAHGTISDDDIIDAELITTEISGGSQENIRSIKFDNDSMEPTILKCAVCGVDTDDNILVDNKIYLIKFPNIGETIRRLQIKSNGVLVVADNKNVEPELLPVEVIESGVILGRVRWIHNKV